MELRELYPTLTTEQRESLARSAGTDVGYLWQIATQWRGKRAGLGMIQKLAAADSRLKVEHLVAEFTGPAESAQPVTNGSEVR